MAVRIRLTRVGATKQPTYRVVVADSRSARDSRSIETLGHYNPRKDPVEFEVDADKAKAWIAKGALPSDTVARLFRNAGVLPPDSGRQYPEKPAKAEKPKGKKAAQASAPAAAPKAEAPGAQAAEAAEAAEVTDSPETAGTADAEATAAADANAEAAATEATAATEETETAETAEKETSK
jgi:small subunit ribosomal protein S16